MSCKLQNIFLWFLKVSWIARWSKITLMKFETSRNVLQASKYFCIISKSLLECQKVQHSLSEVWQVLECLASFQIFFYDFWKSPGLPKGPRCISWSLTSSGMSDTLQNMFLWFSKDSWIARRSKMTFLKFDKSWNIWQASKYFSMIFKILLDCQEVLNNFSGIVKTPQSLPNFKMLFYDFPGLSEGPRRLS